MKSSLLLLMAILPACIAISQTATYKGTIGKYSIEMELGTEDGENLHG